MTERFDYMQGEYIYHVTRPIWFANGIDRLCLRQYVRPPEHQPYRDHAPLNAAVSSNPGKNVFATFFFSEESIALTTAFDVLEYRPHVVLRVKVSDPALSYLSVADDDRDLTPGAHMRFAADSCHPLQIPEGDLVHPTWGIPFDRIEIKVGKTDSWMVLRDYVGRPDSVHAPAHRHKGRIKLPSMRRLRAKKRLSNRWIDGPWSDWIIPYKHNMWFLFAHVLCLISLLSIGLFWYDKKFMLFAPIGFFTFICAYFILAMTQCGRGTVKAYRMSRKVIKSEGTFGPDQQAKFAGQLYCFRAGARAAAIEFGMAKGLVPALSNKWWLI